MGLDASFYRSRSECMLTLPLALNQTPNKFPPHLVWDVCQTSSSSTYLNDFPTTNQIQRNKVLAQYWDIVPCSPLCLPVSLRSIRLCGGLGAPPPETESYFQKRWKAFPRSVTNNRARHPADGRDAPFGKTRRAVFGGIAGVAAHSEELLASSKLWRQRVLLARVTLAAPSRRWILRSVS